MPTDLSDCYDEDRFDRVLGAIAMDCVMAGGGSDGTLDLCVGVCLVDEEEKLIFNTFVRPQIPITNYRYVSLPYSLKRVLTFKNQPDRSLPFGVWILEYFSSFS